MSFSDRHLGSNSLLLHLHFLFLSFHFFNTDLIPPPLFLTAVIPNWTGCTFLLPQRRENGRHQSVVVSLIALSLAQDGRDLDRILLAGSDKREGSLTISIWANEKAKGNAVRDF